LEAALKVYNISYDLNRPGQNYESLFTAIKAISGVWAKPLLSTWLVATHLTADGIYNRLRPHIDNNDKLLITGCTPDWQGSNLSKPVADWLKSGVLV
jgi:hypothetical protein